MADSNNSSINLAYALYSVPSYPLSFIILLITVALEKKENYNESINILPSLDIEFDYSILRLCLDYNSVDKVVYTTKER
jgi:hypothetical protein